LGFEFLNSIVALTNCQAVVVIFLELATVVELLELPETEDRTTEKATKMVVVAETATL
jgi:hypothetical protein